MHAYQGGPQHTSQRFPYQWAERPLCVCSDSDFQELKPKPAAKQPAAKPPQKRKPAAAKPAASAVSRLQGSSAADAESPVVAPQVEGI